MYKLKKTICYAVCILITALSIGKVKSAVDIKSLGTIFNGSQTIAKLGENTFAIGRWNHTIQIINSDQISAQAPFLSQTLVLPKPIGVQMLAYLDKDKFVSSYDETSLIIAKKRLTQPYKFSKKFSYRKIAKNAGIANSGVSFRNNGVHYLVSGHENGCIIIWQLNGDHLLPLKMINLQSDNPIISPFPLKNIRGLAYWKAGKFVAGSEDGDLVLLDTFGHIIFRKKYNSLAQRGINQIQIFKDYLLVSNCSVGKNDKNLWLYRLNNNQIYYLDSINLKKNKELKQIFTFGITVGKFGKNTVFFASTGEGIIWRGLIINNKIKIMGYKELDNKIGSTVLFDQENKILVESGYNTQIFSVY